MSWNSRKDTKFTNVILVLICIGLIIVLGGLLVTNHKEVREESQRLQKLSEKQETGIDDYESVKEHASELQEVADEEEAGNTDSSKAKQEAAKSEKVTSPQTETPDSAETKVADSTDKTAETGDTQNTDKNSTESGDSEKK